jgi:amino acid adenylation domain-containing protein
MNSTLLHLGEIVEQGAKRFPDHTAYSMGEKRLTYTELEKQSGQLAATLLAEGVQKENRIGILAERSLESFVSVYGILRAGGAFVPLDPTSSVERMAQIIEDANIRIVLTTPAQFRKLRSLDRVLPFAIKLIGIGPEKLSEQKNYTSCLSWDELMATEVDAPVLKFSASQLAYIMYTSGSTGQPKGIMHTHRSGLAYAERSARLYRPGPEDRYASHAPLHFDICTFAYFTAPFCGVHTVVLSEGETKMPASLAQVLVREKITFWYAVPLALIQLLQPGIEENLRQVPMKWVLYGGEPFAPKYVRRLMGLWPNSTFSNVYGPAEVNQCTYFNFSEPPQGEEPIPLGQVWADADYLLLDPDSGETEGVQEGELCIHAETAMQGYWKQESRNLSPFLQVYSPSGILKQYYKTGDLVYFNAQGQLVFKGRIDAQIKKRGYRIDLAEIESAALELDGVQEAACFSTLEGENRMIVLTYQRRQEEEFKEEELIEQCRRRLPSYAFPDRLVELKGFPRTSSGKIIRGQLKDWIEQLNVHKQES